jgi:hypothetical protein
LGTGADVRKHPARGQKHRLVLKMLIALTLIAPLAVLALAITIWSNS